MQFSAGFSAPRGDSSEDDGYSSCGKHGLYDVVCTKPKLGWLGPQAMRRISRLAGFSLPLTEPPVAAAALLSSTGRGRHHLLPAASARIRDCRVPLLLLRGCSPAGARAQRGSSTTISGPSGDAALAVSCLRWRFTLSHLALSSVCVAASLPAAAVLVGLGELVPEEAMLVLGDELLEEPECGGILHCSSSPMVEADGIDGKTSWGSGGGNACSLMAGTTAARIGGGGGGGTASLMTVTAG